MFSSPTPLRLPTYVGPVVAISGDSKNEGFLLATVEKKQSYLLESLANEGIFSKVFPDPVGVNPFFVTAQVYSPGEPVTKEKVFTSVTGARKKTSEPLSKSLVCNPKAVTEPCSPYGLNRVIRMARLDSLRAPEHRSAVFTLLEKIGLTSDVFPVSRFFYKVRLISTSVHAQFVDELTRFNLNLRLDGPLFHSIWDGGSTTSLVYREPTRAPTRRVGWGAPEKKHAHASALVVTDPPFSLTLPGLYLAPREGEPLTP